MFGGRPVPGRTRSPPSQPARRAPIAHVRVCVRFALSNFSLKELICDLKDIRSVQEKANRSTAAAYKRQPVSANRVRAYSVSAVLKVRLKYPVSVIAREIHCEAACKDSRECYR